MLSFDIETLPLDSSMALPYPDDRDAPANYKSIEAISKWRDLDEAAWEVGRIKAYSINPRLGRVCAIGYADGEASWGETAPQEADEARVIEQFWGLVWTRGQVCGWNSLGFDLPFLLVRSALLEVPVPKGIGAYLRRYSYTPHLDCKMALLNWPSGYPKGEGLSEWAVAFGLQPKSGHGSEVYAMAQQGDWGAIGDYAADDALLTHGIADRLAGWLA